MRVLIYNEIDPDDIPELGKITRFLKNNDFRSADVKKVDDNLYRARLNKADRLLFTLYKTQQHTYALILEHIKNHAYEKSRFLRRGVKIKEALIPTIDNVNPDTLDTLPHLEQPTSRFHLLQKPVTFDNAQQRIYNLSPPIIIIGTAGSGKTLLLLEKMKHCRGNVLYITQSAYLANHSQNLYYANQYRSTQQTVSFLSYQDFLDSIAVPSGKAMGLSAFKQWFANHINATDIKDEQALFEEFRGVITGSSIKNAFLSKDEYQALGVKESIFIKSQRADVYTLFDRYLQHLKTASLYDHNLVSFDYLRRPKKCYDFIVVDEVQDISSVQLYLILSSLKDPGHFLLCGDANQIVYPNFFSWTKIRSLFLEISTQTSTNDATSITQILNTNYRNSPIIIEAANKLLRMKNWRFGSIDKESHYEMKASANVNQGQLAFLFDDSKTLADIDNKTHASRNFAVIVLYDEWKVIAAKHFKTPLIFSVQECKGLEYENVILFNLVSSASQPFKDICEGVTSDILDQPVRYARNKDKTDKSLEKYKFFINALFVAMTRAETNLYWIEGADHPLLALFPHQQTQHCTDDIDFQASSEEEWQHEASKLEQQGRSAQAQQIRQQILQQQIPAWSVIAGAEIAQLFETAFELNDKKAKLLLFEYTLVYEDHLARNALIEIDFAPAFHPEDGKKQLLIKYFMMYQQEQLDAIKRQMTRYGVDFRNPFNQTPLMIGAWLGSDKVIQLANSLHADAYLANNKGFNAFQIALEQACLHSSYATEKLPTVYTLLRPEVLSIRLDNQLVKLDHHQIEFFLINLMIALFYRIVPENMILSNGAYTGSNLVNAIEHWPLSILPESFYDATYISSILATHQLTQTNNEHPALFVQISDDNYLLNPNIMLKAEGEWLYVYDILLFDDLAISYQDNVADFDTNILYKNLLAEKIANYKKLLDI